VPMSVPSFIILILELVLFEIDNAPIVSITQLRLGRNILHLLKFIVIIV
jgi:hypothetical protein